MTTQQGKFELTFWGGVLKREVGNDFKWKRHHETFDQAQDEARRVLGAMSNRNAHPAII